MKPGSAVLVFVLALAVGAAAQQTTCVEMAQEPHHSVVLKTNSYRVYLLTLGRLGKTQLICGGHYYFYVVATESDTVTTTPGEAGTTRLLHPGEGRFVFNPRPRMIENMRSTEHRELVVEFLKTVDFHPAGPYADEPIDNDAFSNAPGDVPDTWTLTYSKGGMTALKMQLAVKDSLTVDTPDHVLFALTDLTLEDTAEGGNSRTIQLRAGEAFALPGGSAHKLTNPGKSPVKFVLIEI